MLKLEDFGIQAPFNMMKSTVKSLQPYGENKMLVHVNKNAAKAVEIFVLWWYTLWNTIYTYSVNALSLFWTSKVQIEKLLFCEGKDVKCKQNVKQNVTRKTTYWIQEDLNPSTCIFAWREFQSLGLLIFFSLERYQPIHMRRYVKIRARSNRCWISPRRNHTQVST